MDKKICCYLGNEQPECLLYRHICYFLFNTPFQTTNKIKGNDGRFLHCTLSKEWLLFHKPYLQSLPTVLHKVGTVWINVLHRIVAFIFHVLCAHRMRRHLANLPYARGSPLNQVLLAEASGIATCLCIHSVCNTHTPIRCIYYARGLTITSHIWSSKHTRPCINTSARHPTETPLRRVAGNFICSKWMMWLPIEVKVGETRRLIETHFIRALTKQREWRYPQRRMFSMCELMKLLAFEPQEYGGPVVHSTVKFKCKHKSTTQLNEAKTTKLPKHSRIMSKHYRIKRNHCRIVSKHTGM